jgi:hypothetical protein
MASELKKANPTFSARLQFLKLPLQTQQTFTHDLRWIQGLVESPKFSDKGLGYLLLALLTQRLELEFGQKLNFQQTLNILREAPGLAWTTAHQALTQQETRSEGPDDEPPSWLPGMRGTLHLDLAILTDLLLGKLILDDKPKVAKVINPSPKKPIPGPSVPNRTVSPFRLSHNFKPRSMTSFQKVVPDMASPKHGVGKEMDLASPQEAVMKSEET